MQNDYCIYWHHNRPAILFKFTGAGHKNSSSQHLKQILVFNYNLYTIDFGRTKGWACVGYIRISWNLDGFQSTKAVTSTSTTSINAGRLVVLKETGTFQHSFKKKFNCLPESIRSCINYKVFLYLSK